MNDDVVYDFDPRNLPQDLLAAIGLAITCSAQTEGMVDDAIHGCLGVDIEYGMATTTHMPIPLKFSVLRSTAEIRIDDLDALDVLNNILSEVKTAFDKRNDLAHNKWCSHPETGEIFRTKVTARSRLEGELLPMSIDGIKSDALFIYSAGIRLHQFLSIQGLLPAFPSGSRPRDHKSKAARKKRRAARDKSV